MLIELYTREQCSNCVVVKNALNKADLNYKEYVIDRDITRENVLNLFPEAKILPVVVVDGTWIGGKDEILRIVAQKNQNEHEMKDANAYRLE